MSEPHTATAMMMLDREQNSLFRSLQVRDRAVVFSIAASMMDKHFDPLKIEDMRDVRQMMHDALVDAADLAIHKERELHAGDMKLIEAWMKTRLDLELLTPAQPIIAEPIA